MSDRIAVIEGVRTPFCRAGGLFSEFEADDLAAYAIQGLLALVDVAPEDVDELIFGNVITPVHAANPARLFAIKGGLPVSVPAVTVSRNCASGLEALALACNKINLGQAKIMVAGGAESMTHFPLAFSEDMRRFLLRDSKAKGLMAKLRNFLTFRPKLLAPQPVGLTDPLCGLSMGQTAEVLVRELAVSREEQDRFALESQQRAARAKTAGRLAAEIVPVPIPPKYSALQFDDDGIRDNQTLEALKSLKPAFDKLAGTVTAGTSSQVTDGAVALLLMSEEEATRRGLKPLGYIRAFASAGLEPSRMGLGPVYATAKLLDQAKMKLSDFALIEINEAFAAQVLSVCKAMASEEFAKKYLGRNEAVGVIDPERLNVNGGAIALGHPLGATGARMVVTLLKELRRRGESLGLATLCVGGGQGQAMAVEVEP